MGFALVWHVWWAALLGFTAILTALIARAFVRDTEQTIPADEIARSHGAWLAAIAETSGVNRDAEIHPANRGLAAPDEVSS